MFSSKELISFVFANENDIYYGEDLLKLNLNQYLWTKLHESYETVYFLSAAENSFNVRSFGDSTCIAYDSGKKSITKLLSFIGSTEQDKLGAWMLRQLRAKPNQAVAFVCPLEDFCTVLADDRWTTVLQSIAEEKKRSGIFVLTAPATSERTKDLLLNSPVFDRLGETAVTDLRGGELRELYGPIKRNKWDSCLFLNTFPRERVRSLLLHLAMEYPDRCQSCQELDTLADYLTGYLHDPQSQQEEPLLTSNLPAGYLLYRELYEQLASESVWNRLAKQSAKAFPKHSSASLCREAPVLRDLKCYAGKCMMLRLPKWVREQDGEGRRADKILENIQREVSAPKNRPENKEITAAAEEFLSQLDAVNADDLDTYLQLLQAIEFCAGRVYAEPGREETGRVLAIIEKLRSGISISGACFTMRRDLKLYQSQAAPGSLQSAKLLRMNKQLATLEELRKRYVDLVNASILELTMPASTTHIMDQLEELKQEVEECEEQIPQIQDLPLGEDEFGDDFSFRPEDYAYIPPNLKLN